MDDPGVVKENIDRFMREIAMENIPFEQLSLPFEMDEALGLLRDLY